MQHQRLEGPSAVRPHQTGSQTFQSKLVGASGPEGFERREKEARLGADLGLDGGGYLDVLGIEQDESRIAHRRSDADLEGGSRFDGGGGARRERCGGACVKSLRTGERHRIRSGWWCRWWCRGRSGRWFDGWRGRGGAGRNQGRYGQQQQWRLKAGPGAIYMSLII